MRSDPGSCGADTRVQRRHHRRTRSLEATRSRRRVHRHLARHESGFDLSSDRHALADVAATRFVTGDIIRDRVERRSPPAAPVLTKPFELGELERTILGGQAELGTQSVSRARDDPARELMLAGAAGSAAAAGPSFARGLWRIAAADVSSGNRVDAASRRTGNVPGDDRSDRPGADQRRSRELHLPLRRGRAEHGRRAHPRGARAASTCASCSTGSAFAARRADSSTRLRTAGVEIAVFNPPGFRRWFGLVPRDHRKLLVVDSSIGITGGVGVGREWTTGVQKPRIARAGATPP